MDIAVGSGDNPTNYLGLAHYLEHTLFLGTEKYPVVDNFQEFIKEHGGSYNAYTSYENTNYFFDSQHEHLDAALDRFADFFVAPLFNADFVERERNVVDSEYHLGLKDDGRRYYAVLQEAFNPHHPITLFSVGNKDTLQGNTEELREKLIGFYRKHYRPNLMKLVVYGKESHEELKRMVDSRFGGLAAQKAAARDIKEPLFAPGRLPAALELKPVQERRFIDYYFPIESQDENFRSKPAKYIEHLLESRGENSIYRSLKDKGWINNLGAGLDMSFPEGALFNIFVDLTPAGEEHRDDITRLIFQTVRLIEKEGVAEWRFKELRSRAAVKFKYKQQEKAIQHVRTLSRRMQKIPTERILSNSLWDEYEPEKIKRILKDINEGNLLMVFVSPSAQETRQENYYQVSYDLRPLSDERLALYGTPMVKETISLPQPNSLISEDIKIASHPWDKKKPQKLAIQNINAWYQFDDSFQSPRIDIRLVIRSPEPVKGTKEWLMSKLLRELMREQLSKESYAADVAGYGFHVGHSHYGYKLYLRGYNTNFSKWMTQAMKSFMNHKFSEQDFQRIKKNTERNLNNSLKASPTRRLNDALDETLISHAWDESTQLKELVDISLVDIEEFAVRSFKEVAITAFAAGNLPQANAEALLEDLIRKFPPPVHPLEKIDLRSPLARLKEQGPFLVRTNSVHQDSAILILFQAKDYDYETRALTALLAQLLQPLFFQKLRTEQELGYLVSAYYKKMFQLPGVAFVVQSNHKHSFALNERIDNFLQDAISHLQDLPNEEFNNYKEGIINTLREEPRDLGDLISRGWGSLIDGILSFDDRERAALAIERVTKAQFLAYYKDFFQPGNKISIFTDTSLQEEGAPPSGEWIENYLTFKQDLL